MIGTLLAHDSGLARGALAYVLGVEDDIRVVATVEQFDRVATVAGAHRPDVIVLDLELVPPEFLPQSWSSAVEPAAVLVLAELRRAHLLAPMMAWQSSRTGCVAKESSPNRLVDAVRRLAAGELTLDPELVVAALQADQHPLTLRERQTLSVAAEGLPVGEIAERLTLAPGTVRNHLSRVIGKTGARTRIEAIRIAQQAGWI